MTVFATKWLHGAIALGLSCAGCNPLVYQKIIEDAPVHTFKLRGAGGVTGHGPLGLVYPPLDDKVGYLLMAGGGQASLAWLKLNRGAEPVPTFASSEQLEALVAPIPYPTTMRITGLARVPSPLTTEDSPHAIMAVRNDTRPELAQIVRFQASEFERVDLTLQDRPDAPDAIVAPHITGRPASNFGRQLAAINLDADQNDPDYEVMVGSDDGVLVYANLARDHAVYEDARELILAAEPDAFSGSNEPEGYGFTLCSNTTEWNAFIAGKLLADDVPVFVIAGSSGLSFVGIPATLFNNRVGAPIYDCALQTIPLPTGASLSFGAALLVSDLNGDAHDDLVVGDPDANVAFVFHGGAAGLASTPTHVLDSDREGVDEFGAALGRADLSGDIGSVLVVGAPGTNLGARTQAGAAYVYPLDGTELLASLEDLHPDRNARYGTWVGGVFRSEQDELVVMGKVEGRVYERIGETDPAAGD